MTDSTISTEELKCNQYKIHFRLVLTDYVIGVGMTGKEAHHSQVWRVRKGWCVYVLVVSLTESQSASQQR